MPDVAQLIQYGASPRASLGIVRATRALALLRGRDYALPQDVQDIAPDILRHRLVLSYDALADDIPADHIVARIMASVPLPSVAPAAAAPNGHRPAPAAGAGRPRGPWPGLRSRRPQPALAGQRPRPRDAGRLPRRRRPTTARARAEAVAVAGCSCWSPASSTGCCRATTSACCPGRAARRGSRGSTGPATTCAGWTGRSPPAPRCRTSGDRRRPRAGDLAGRRPVGQPRLRHRPVLKRDLVIAAAAAMAHLTVRGGNRIGAVVGTGSGAPSRARLARRAGPRPASRRRMPARPGRKEAQGLLRAIAAYRDPARPRRPGRR